MAIDIPQSETDERVVAIPEQDLKSAIAATSPHESLAAIIHRAVRSLSMVRATFDVALLYLPDNLSLGFRSDPADEHSDFDLHDSVKALCSGLRIPLQVINDDAVSYYCRCSVSWRLSLALYTKAGGTPWRLNGMDERHAFVGLSYCIRKGVDPKFVTCCSQIFDADGTNLRFLLYESADTHFQGDNPYLPRQDMYRLMARTLSLYQKQKGSVPTRLVVHKTTPFTSDEMDGCNDALTGIDDLELLTLTQDVPWRGIRIEPPRFQDQKKGTPASYPLHRGAALPLGPFDYLLWTQGTCDGIGDGNYFKEGKSIPHPMRITRHQGASGFHTSAREILGLTKMNWNNDSLYDWAPVTLSYSSILARIVKRMGSLSQTPYDFRYFM